MSDVINVLEKTNKPVNQEFQIKIYLSKMGERIPSWSSGKESVLPLYGAGVQSLTKELRYIYIHTERKL